MCRKSIGPLVVAICLAISVSARPASLDEYLAVDGDLVAVGTYRRETREPAPTPSVAAEVEDLLGTGNAPKKNVKNASGKSDEGGYYKTYGSDADGEKGYLKATYSKGDHGYKTFDTFHKQDGDKYEFEEHTAYGKARAGEKEAANHRASRADSTGDHDAAGTRVYETASDALRDEGESPYEAEDEDVGVAGYNDDYAGRYSIAPVSAGYANDDGHVASYDQDDHDDRDGQDDRAHGSYRSSDSSSDTAEGGDYEGYHY